jgi:hypothetical protein
VIPSRAKKNQKTPLKTPKPAPTAETFFYDNTVFVLQGCALEYCHNTLVVLPYKCSLANAAHYPNFTSQTTILAPAIHLQPPSITTCLPWFQNGTAISLLTKNIPEREKNGSFYTVLYRENKKHICDSSRFQRATSMQKHEKTTSCRFYTP